ncbi:hypothetical protein T4E_10422 [Trichinella pseudospiralis]|uniref:Uncharacterized protein n=1 Tax=Trichinella pseudospiralis TaxID=6337 RepID=A0A0V0XEE7_TRIPS|nr:hypothetical protein T4E_5746 [Trichinella pseudospiralis]KRX86367.1 hypothetical protein T4E_10422 [Trichinella pseudospiralis]
MDASSNTIIADMPEDILKKIFSYVDQYEGWFANCPCLLMETVVELVKQLDTGEQDELLKLFMHHASGT